MKSNGAYVYYDPLQELCEGYAELNPEQRIAFNRFRVSFEIDRAERGYKRWLRQQQGITELTPQRPASS